MLTRGLKGFHMRGTRTELSTAGFDSSLQNVASDPNGGAYNVGLRIPAAAAIPNTPQNRYLYMLSMMRVNAHAKTRLVGIRQLVTIGQFVTNPVGGCNYPLEVEVKSPVWHFVDGNITWYVQRVPPISIPTTSLSAADTNEDTEGLQFAYAVTPALIYQTNNPTYSPPNGGNPYGVALVPDLSGFHDLRFPWRSEHSWDNTVDIEIEGPCDVALYASVQQTNPATRCLLNVADNQIPFISEEDAFTVRFPQAVYWRIAGSLIFEETQYIEEPRGLQEG